ncbi:MAG: hypothetical protein ABW162_08780 [Candidatus Sedimenticola sp. PURPLELP]
MDEEKPVIRRLHMGCGEPLRLVVPTRTESVPDTLNEKESTEGKARHENSNSKGFKR